MAFIFPLPGAQGQTAERENRTRVLEALTKEGEGGFEERFLLGEYGGFGSSIHVRLQQTADMAEPEGSEGTFVLAVPLERSFAVDTALAFIKARMDQRSSGNMLVAFLGDEYSRLPPDVRGLSHKGLRDLLSLPDMPENWILCYMDIDKAPKGILIRHGTGSYIAPLELTRPLRGLFRDYGIPAFFEIRYNELYKLGLAAGPEELSLAWEAEINGICLSEDPAALRRRSSPDFLTPEAVAGVLLDYREKLEFPVQNPDRHYSFFTLPWTQDIAFVSEKTAVITLLCMAAVFIFFILVYSAVYRQMFFSKLRLFLKHSWIFIIFLPLLVMVLAGAGFLYDFLLILFKKPQAQGDYPAAGLVILLAVWLFYIPSHLLDYMHIPRKHNFYGASAMILATAGLFAAAVIDFTYIPVFLWAFLFTFLGALFRKAALVIISALLIPMQALGAFINIRETGSGILADLFLNAGSLGSLAAALQIAVLSLPFILLLKRGAVIINRGKKNPVRNLLLFRIAVLVLILGSMAVYVLTLPGGKPETVRLVKKDQDAVLDLSLRDIFFQESRILEFRLGARGSPVRFDLFLEAPGSGARPLVYSAPFPFREEGGVIVFELGENPPNPLSAEIILPRDFSGSVRAEALYNAWDREIDGEREPETDDYILRVSRTRALTASGTPD
ncbi:MAG: hypothetical protein LBC62_08885 [Treponema sp.]|jgi:hypothetical protein|nr:hypothetical protein [Treponema sp.]